MHSLIRENLETIEDNGHFGKNDESRNITKYSSNATQKNTSQKKVVDL